MIMVPKKNKNKIKTTSNSSDHLFYLHENIWKANLSQHHNWREDYMFEAYESNTQLSYQITKTNEKQTNKDNLREISHPMFP
jgi:hypothetical protein